MTSLLLAIDTASERCSAAVFDMKANAVLARAEPEIGRGHAERLMDVIAGVLAEAGSGYGDLGRLAVTTGPGSFTGLRVGVAAVRGLSLSLGIPAVGVSTLEALAEPHLRKGSPVLAVLDAKRGELYAALFSANGTVLREAEAIAPQELGDFIAGAGQAPTSVGSGADIAAGALAPRQIAIASREGTADIAAVARLAAGRPAGLAPRPLYLRGADAKPQISAGLLRLSGTSTSS